MPLDVAGAAALVIGPTTGHGYADDAFNGWLGLRVLSVVAGIG